MDTDMVSASVIRIIVRVPSSGRAHTCSEGPSLALAWRSARLRITSSRPTARASPPHNRARVPRSVSHVLSSRVRASCHAFSHADGTRLGRMFRAVRVGPVKYPPAGRPAAVSLPAVDGRSAVGALPGRAVRSGVVPGPVVAVAGRAVAAVAAVAGAGSRPQRRAPLQQSLDIPQLS